MSLFNHFLPRQYYFIFYSKKFIAPSSNNSYCPNSEYLLISTIFSSIFNVCNIFIAFEFPWFLVFGFFGILSIGWRHSNSSNRHHETFMHFNGQAIEILLESLNNMSFRTEKMKWMTVGRYTSSIMYAASKNHANRFELLNWINVIWASRKFVTNKCMYFTLCCCQYILKTPALIPPLPMHISRSLLYTTSGSHFGFVKFSHAKCIAFWNSFVNGWENYGVFIL